MAFVMLVSIGTAVAVIALWINGAEDYFRTGGGAKDDGATRNFATVSDGEIRRTPDVERECVGRHPAPGASNRRGIA